MLELGSFASEEHQKIVDFINKNKIPAFFVGPIYRLSKNIGRNKSFIDLSELIVAIKQTPILNKTILLKGSRGIKLEKMVEYL